MHGNVVRLKPTHLSNREIVSGLKKGDSRCADGLVDRFGVSIDRRVWRLLGADSEHHDVVQQVYAQILESVGSLRDPEALTQWIVKVTVNVVRNELRHRKYRRIVKLDEAPGLELLDNTDTEDRMRLARGYKILESMKTDLRIAFVMRFIEGAELMDVASAVGCSLSTVKRRISRARDVFMKKAKRDPILSSLVTQGVGDEQ